MTLRISVITVTLDSERFLAECLASVAGQGDSLHEHIIVDGGSTDATVEMIKAHAASDSRIRWVSEPDQGIADAMNKGVALSSGDVVTHLNSDDFYPHSQVLSTVAACFSRNPMKQWITAGTTVVSEEGRRIRDIRVRRYSFNRLLRGNILLHPSTFIKRELFDTAGGFDVSLSYCMDYELYLRLGIVSPPLVVDELLSCFRSHEESCSVSHAAEMSAEEFRVRMDYLSNNGYSTVMYQICHQIRKFIGGILQS